MKKGWKKQLAAVLVAATVLGTAMEPAFISDNTVYAAQTAQNVLDETIEVGSSKTFKQYDVTGDGKADTLKIKATKKSVEVYVNGKKTYTKKTKTFEDVMVSLYTLKGKKPMLALNSDWYSQLFSTLLQYKSGKFVQQINMSNEKGFAFGRDLKITADKITTIRNSTVLEMQRLLTHTRKRVENGAVQNTENLCRSHTMSPKLPQSRISRFTQALI